MKTWIGQLMATLVIVIIALAIYHLGFVREMRWIDKPEGEVATVSLSDWNSDRLLRGFDNMPPDDFILPAEKSKVSVVYIIAYEKVRSSFFTEGYKREKGSGIIISEDGHIVTNEHVVKRADFIEITLDDKREFIAEVVGSDPSTDLALLKIEANELPFLIFGNSDSLRVGEWILAIGNPFGLQSTVTAGIVSAKARNIDALDKNDIESFIQSDAVINPGSSGGALVNTDGLLMGVFTAIISSSGSYEGLSFAIPANLAQKVIIDLKQFGSVQRGKLGITIADIDAQIAQENNLPEIKGVQILGINLNSAAAEAGFRKGDIIRGIENKTIGSTSEFYEQINRYRPGDVIAIEYYRNGKEKVDKVTLRNHLNTTDYLSVRSDKILKDIGIEVRDLNSIEKKRMNTEGVMIISISKGSIISATNMEPGYIVEYVNDMRVETAHEFIQLIKNSGEEVIFKGFYERYPGRFPYTFHMPPKD